MQFHHLSPKTKLKRRKRIGRGGKRGTYSGRGIKGQKARGGARIRPQERDILKRIPKLRGYKFRSFRVKPEVVNLGDIDKKFEAGAIVSPKTLLEAGLIHRKKGRVPKVKILGGGISKKSFVFKDVILSKSAASRIKK